MGGLGLIVFFAILFSVVLGLTPLVGAILNKNYQKGVRFERERIRFYKEELKADLALRTAGSHGAYDLIIVRKGFVTFIQCKVTEDPREAERLLKSFTEKPPLPPGDYQQRMEVKIIGSKELGCVSV